MEENAAARIGRQVSRLRAAVVSDLREHEQVLRATAGFFAGSEKVTAREFAAFVGKLKLTEHDPGVRSLALIVPVRRKDASAWLAERRADGQDIEKVLTSGDRPDLFLVQYSEPSLPGARALGWDVGTDRATRAGIERARDTGEAALAGPLAVPHATSGPILSLVYPLYRMATVPPAVPARREEFRGVLSLFLNVRSLMDEALTGGDPDFEVELFDGPAVEPARPLHAPAREPGAPRPGARARRSTDSLPIGGKTLTFVHTTLPAFEKSQGSVRPFLVLGGGLSMTLLLFGLLWALASTRVAR